jgi:Flp pilus assembly protein TadD
MRTTSLTLTAVLAGAVCTSAAFSAGPPSTAADEAFKLRMDGHSDEAKVLLETSLARSPDDATAWFELARTEFYQFQFNDAADAIARAIELAPENGRYHYFAGITAGCNAISRAHDGEPPDRINAELGRSLAAFDSAVDVDPDFHEARVQLINMLIQTPPKDGGSRAAARKHVKALESKDAVYGVAGRCTLMNDSKPQKAVELWQEAVASHATRADAHAGLAKSCLRAGDVDLALTHIDEAIRLDPSHHAVLLTLCRHYVSEGDPASAQKAVERYLAADPPPPAPLRAYATFCLAQLQKMQGNREQAEALLAEARQIDPHVWRTYMEPSEVLFGAP